MAARPHVPPGARAGTRAGQLPHKHTPAPAAKAAKAKQADFRRAVLCLGGNREERFSLPASKSRTWLWLDIDIIRVFFDYAIEELLQVI